MGNFLDCLGICFVFFWNFGDFFRIFLIFCFFENMGSLWAIV